MINLAGVKGRISNILAQVELAKAGVTPVHGPEQGEVQTSIHGVLEFAGGERAHFHRLWYYWSVGIEPALPFPAAYELNERLGGEVRVDGYAGGKKVAGPVSRYHVDTQEGLCELVKAMRSVFSCPGVETATAAKDALVQFAAAPLVGTQLELAEMKALAALAAETQNIKDQLRLLDTAVKIGLGAFSAADPEVIQVLDQQLAAVAEKTKRSLRSIVHCQNAEEQMFAVLELESVHRQEAAILRRLNRHDEARLLDGSAALRRDEAIGYARLYNEQLAQAPADDNHQRHRRAFTLIMLSRMLGRQGDRSLARQAAEQARELVAQQPEYYRTDLRRWLELWK